MRLVDATGSPFPAPDLTFSAEEIGEDAFGWNIPLASLTPALSGRVQASGAIIREGVADDIAIGGKTHNALERLSKSKAAIRLVALEYGWCRLVAEKARLLSSDEQEYATRESVVFDQSSDGADDFLKLEDRCRRRCDLGEGSGLQVTKHHFGCDRVRADDRF